MSFGSTNLHRHQLKQQHQPRDQPANYHRREVKRSLVMRFREMRASGTLNLANYDHYVGFDSRSTTQKSTDFYGGSMETTKHYHGNRIVGKIVVHRPTGKTQFFLRDDA